MKPFVYYRARDEAEALRVVGPRSAFLAGGTDLMQLHKTGIAAPDQVIDIGRLALNGITVGETEIVIGALARMCDVAREPVIRVHYPVISQALLSSASPQVRN